jgi:hypothetical protein
MAWDAFAARCESDTVTEIDDFAVSVAFERWHKKATLPGLSDKKLDKLFKGKK